VPLSTAFFHTRRNLRRAATATSTAETHDDDRGLPRAAALRLLHLCARRDPKPSTRTAIVKCRCPPHAECLKPWPKDYFPPLFLARCVRSGGGVFGCSRPIALALLAVAGSAILREHLLSRGRRGVGDGDLLDVRLLFFLVSAGKHYRNTARPSVLVAIKILPVKQREAPKRNSGRTSQFCRNRVETLGQGSPIMAVLLLRHQALARYRPIAQ
jgi:hypothetical protein